MPALSPALPPDEKVSAWSLIKPYWVSEEKKTAWAMLIAIIAMNLMVVWINVRLNRWSADFYNALQTKNVRDFPHLLMIFSGLAFGYIMLAELINAEHGLGFLLMASQRRGMSEHIILILIIIGLLAYGIDRLLFWFQRGLFPYRAVED